MANDSCTLYTFAVGAQVGAQHAAHPTAPTHPTAIKVARLTSGTYPDDWHLWAEKYVEGHRDLELLEIAGIRFVDDRGDCQPICHDV